MADKHLRPWIWQRHDWPQFRWDSARLAQPLAAARKAQGELTGMARLLDPDSDLHAQLEMLTSEGVATSAIEGERFDPNALRNSLARRLGLPTAGLPAPSRSVEGLVDVLLDATQKLDKPLTQRMLASWQAALFPTGRSGLAKIRVGTLRGASPMRIVSAPVGRRFTMRRLRGAGSSGNSNAFLTGSTSHRRRWMDSRAPVWPMLGSSSFTRSKTVMGASVVPSSIVRLPRMSTGQRGSIAFQQDSWRFAASTTRHYRRCRAAI